MRSDVDVRLAATLKQIRMFLFWLHTVLVTLTLQALARTQVLLENRRESVIFGTSGRLETRQIYPELQDELRRLEEISRHWGLDEPEEW